MRDISMATSINIGLSGANRVLSSLRLLKLSDNFICAKLKLKFQKESSIVQKLRHPKQLFGKPQNIQDVRYVLNNKCCMLIFKHTYIIQIVPKVDIKPVIVHKA